MLSGWGCGLPSYSFWGKQFIGNVQVQGGILGQDMGPGEQGVQELEAGWAAGAQAKSRNEVGAGSQGGQVRAPPLP